MPAVPGLRQASPHENRSITVHSAMVGATCFAITRRFATKQAGGASEQGDASGIGVGVLDSCFHRSAHARCSAGSLFPGISRCLQPRPECLHSWRWWPPSTFTTCSSLFLWTWIIHWVLEGLIRWSSRHGSCCWHPLTTHPSYCARRECTARASGRGCMPLQCTSKRVRAPPSPARPATNARPASSTVGCASEPLHRMQCALALHPSAC